MAENVWVQTQWHSCFSKCVASWEFSVIIDYLSSYEKYVYYQST